MALHRAPELPATDATVILPWKGRRTLFSNRSTSLAVTAVPEPKQQQQTEQDQGAQQQTRNATLIEIRGIAFRLLQSQITTGFTRCQLAALDLANLL